MAALVALAVVLGACSPAVPGTTGAPAPLYVTGGTAGTVTPISAESGLPLSLPIPAGPAPWQVVAGADGSLLVSSVAPRSAGVLTYVSRTPGTPGTPGTPIRSGVLRGWSTRPVPVDDDVAESQLAGGGRYAIVAYAQRARQAGTPAPPCRMALVDLRAGTLAASYSICRAREAVHGLALLDSDSGPVAYVSLWAAGAVVDGRWEPAHGRLVAVDAASGGLLQELTGSEIAGELLLAPGPGRGPLRLYEMDGVPSGGTSSDDTPQASDWRVRILDPQSLLPLAELPVEWPRRRLAVTADGNHAYALVDLTGVVHVDLRTGAVNRIAQLPDTGLTLAVTDRRVYVTHPEGDDLWVIDRARGFLRERVRVAMHPICITWGAL